MTTHTELGVSLTTPEPLLPREQLLLKPLSGLASAASVLVALTCVVSVAEMWSFWSAYQLADDYVAGVGGVTMSDVEGADSRNFAFGMVLLLVTVATAVVFIVWLWQARLNAERINPNGHRMRRGWTIGGWFCPVVNLWFPFRIVTDIWSVSVPEGTVVRGRPVTRWWTAWIATWIAVAIMRQDARTAVTVEALQGVAVANTVATIAQCLAGVFVIVVVRQISAWQAVPRQV
ncbi:MAG TPA: DUF4328 domain-containing protein [Actinophytocola sp.]|nr:DUF4328 domain-containing protein [Actinophytocola sp.]